MRAVGGEYRRTDVTADLGCSECACLAAATPPLQRLRSAIPATVPALHRSRTTCDCVSCGESSEAASGVVCSVVEEDVMLGVGAEVRRHGVVRE